MALVRQTPQPQSPDHRIVSLLALQYASQQLWSLVNDASSPGGYGTTSIFLFRHFIDPRTCLLTAPKYAELR